MKNVTKNKLLHCFKPQVLEFESESESIKNKDDIEIFKIKPPCLDVDFTRTSEETNRNSYGLKQNLFKIFKVAMFHTSLNKRVCDEKMWQHSLQSKSIRNLLSINRRNDFNLNEDKSAKNGSNNKEIIKSMPNSSSSNPLRKPNTSNSSKPDSLNQKQDSKMRRNLMGFSCFNSGIIYLILLSLLVTIFWGKFFAVFFTSLWLCFDLGRRQSSGRMSKPIMWTPVRDRRHGHR